MNTTKLKLVRFVLATAIGSLLWAGCSTPDNSQGYSMTDNRPADLTKRKADTNPENRTGLSSRAGGVYDVPSDNTINEAAGGQRY